MTHRRHGLGLSFLALTCAALLVVGSLPSPAGGVAGSDEGRPSNPVAGSGQTHIDRPLTSDRPGEYPLGRGTVESGADFGSPKAGSGDPDRLGAKGSPYRSRSSGRPRGPGLEGNSITGGSITRDGASGLPE